MPISLYDAVVPSNLQILRAMDELLDKARSLTEEMRVTEGEIIDARLVPDMLPLGYQILSCSDHSAGAIRGVEAGIFAPEITTWPTTIDGLREVTRAAIADLDAIDPKSLDALEEAEVYFVARDVRLPFTGAGFLLSFSQPNFYFHAATAYDVLRAKGAAIGKLDFMGVPRTKG